MMNTPYKPDNYTPQERSEYNKAYYRNNRDRINTRRKARRHIHAAQLRTRSVVLQTVFPPEAQEYLLAALQHDSAVQITTTLRTEHLREICACRAFLVVVHNDVDCAVSQMAQNLLNTSPKI
jgi:hypothetical protein